MYDRSRSSNGGGLFRTSNENYLRFIKKSSFGIFLRILKNLYF